MKEWTVEQLVATLLEAADADSGVVLNVFGVNSCRFVVRMADDAVWLETDGEVDEM